MPSFPYKEQEEDLNTRSESAIKETAKKNDKKNRKNINSVKITESRTRNN